MAFHKLIGLGICLLLYLTLVCFPLKNMLAVSKLVCQGAQQRERLGLQSSSSGDGQPSRKAVKQAKRPGISVLSAVSEGVQGRLG